MKYRMERWFFAHPPLNLKPLKECHMTIGIIGSGAIGAAFARTLARAGIEAIISNSRGPDSLRELVSHRDAAH